MRPALASRAGQTSDAPYHPDGTGLLHPNVALEGLASKSVALTSAKDNGGKPFRLAVMQEGLTATHVSLRDMIRFAFHAKSYDQIIGGPDWINTQFYDIKAIWPDDATADPIVGKWPADLQLELPRLLMQGFLADSFQLKVTEQTRKLPVYALVAANGGPKLNEVQLTPVAPGTAPPRGAHIPSLTQSPTQVMATATNMHSLADFLSISDELGGHLIVDETGLEGDYDFTINGVSMNHTQNPNTTSILQALPDQLGLKLELRQATGVEVLLIESAKQPTIK
jgi:uncharacterized protein (TIGR03435 family)